MKKVVSIVMVILILCGATLGVCATNSRFTVLSRTYEDIWVEDDEIYFWACAIPWEPAKMTIKLKVEEVIDGNYKTIINTSKTETSDELQIMRSIPYGEDRYFKVTINYIVGPDTPTVTKYFYT